MHDDLADLLCRRRDIISDHEFRDRDTLGHLEALKEVSEAIAAWQVAHAAEIDARLGHFLTNASFDKALVYLESEGTWKGH
ncbi:hypothetical protein [Haloferula sp. BvORR071]|uniref:hypothetical protein n=1 Tax=Haloferula sp. BvORR071 TaxID=1396141 RepID=UPI0005571158|nr:hypothetical protein [Haloferula sp. BvORR071]